MFCERVSQSCSTLRLQRIAQKCMMIVSLMFAGCVLLSPISQPMRSSRREKTLALSSGRQVQACRLHVREYLMEAGYCRFETTLPISTAPCSRNMVACEYNGLRDI